MSANAASPASKPAASATSVSTCSPAGPLAPAARAAPGRGRARSTRWPARARSSATRPVPAPTSSTGPAARARELVPERQVGDVAAALDVVPDHVGVHRQYSCACAAAGEQVLQLEQRGVGGQRVQRPVAGRPARGRAPCARSSTTSSRSAGDAGVLEPQRQLGGARARAGHPAHVRGDELPVGVPHPRDVAAVGDAVVEHAEQVELRRPRARACAAPRWRRPGS